MTVFLNVFFSCKPETPQQLETIAFMKGMLYVFTCNFPESIESQQSMKSTD